MFARFLLVSALPKGSPLNTVAVQCTDMSWDLRKLCCIHDRFAEGDYRLTAIAIALFAKSLWRRAAKLELPRGVIRIQDIVTLDEMRDDFAERGIDIGRWNRA